LLRNRDDSFDCPASLYGTLEMKLSAPPTIADSGFGEVRGLFTIACGFAVCMTNTWSPDEGVEMRVPPATLACDERTGGPPRCLRRVQAAVATRKHSHGFVRKVASN
jgi:hypothetical protein